MSELVATYEWPTGTFDPSVPEEALRRARAVTDYAERLNLDELLLDAIADALQERRAARLRRNLSKADPEEMEGYLRATRVCGGWRKRPTPDPTNGALHLTIGFTDEGIDPIVWGETESCNYLVGGSQVRLRSPEGEESGRIRLHFGAPAPLSSRLKDLPVLFEFRLGADIDGQPIDARFDYRADPRSSSFEVRVPVKDGDVIAILSSDGRAIVRAKNGAFLCDDEAATCAAP